MKLTLIPTFALVALFGLASALGEEAEALRRFTMKDGRSFQASIETKADTNVTFRLLNGRTQVVPNSMLSEADRLYVLKWTPFKDSLLRNADFAKATVQQLLELRGYQTFEFDLAGNHILVEGELNGKAQRFLIDTGASTSLLDVNAAKDCGMEIGAFTEKVFGVAGEAPAAVVQVPSLKMGDALITNRRILAADLFEQQGGKGDYGAIFGADFLRELHAVISYREGRMFLKIAPGPEETAEGGDGADKPATVSLPGFRRWTSDDGRTMFAALDEKGDTEVIFRLQNGRKVKLPVDKLSGDDQAYLKNWNELRDQLAADPNFNRLSVKELLELRGYQSLPYRLSGNHIIIDGEANGQKARFLIDTGAHGGVFHIEFAKKVGLDIGPMDQWIYGIGGKAPAANVQVKSLKLGDAIVENREMMAADLESQQRAFGSSHDAIFGANFMRELDAVISYKESLMFIRPGMADQEAEKKEEPAKEEKTAPAAPQEEEQAIDPFPEQAQEKN